MRREPILPPGMDAMLRVFCQHGLVRDCPLTSFARNAFLLKPDGSAMRMLFLSASSSSVPASFARLRAAQLLSQPARLLACVMMETAADLSGVSMAHKDRLEPPGRTYGPCEPLRHPGHCDTERAFPWLFRTDLQTWLQLAGRA